MESSAKYSGYVPPSSFDFTSEDQALACLAVAVCSAEYARFRAMIAANHHSEDQRAIAPAYLIVAIATGASFPELSNREASALRSQRAWASAMIELGSFFRGRIDDPVAEALARGFIKPTPHGFHPVRDQILNAVG
jgi:hypothetical protein